MWYAAPLVGLATLVGFVGGLAAWDFKMPPADSADARRETCLVSRVWEEAYRQPAPDLWHKEDRERVLSAAREACQG